MLHRSRQPTSNSDQWNSLHIINESICNKIRDAIRSRYLLILRKCHENDDFTHCSRLRVELVSVSYGAVRQTRTICEHTISTFVLSSLIGRDGTGQSGAVVGSAFRPNKCPRC